MDSKVAPKKKESQLKYQPHIYNDQRKSDINHKGMTMRCNNTLFPSSNVIDGKTSSHGNKGILRHYHYRSDPKLGPGIVKIRIIPYS